MAAGLELWAHRSGASLSLEDDGSRPERAVEIFRRLQHSPSPLWGGRGTGFLVLGPYGSDSVRAVASTFPDTVIWNHGAAANDVQRLPNVISIPTPSSRYLVSLARATARLRPGATIAIATAKGRFADYAWNGLIAEADEIDLRIEGRFALSAPSPGSPSPLWAGPPAHASPRPESRPTGRDKARAVAQREPRFSAMRAFEKSERAMRAFEAFSGRGYSAVLTIGPVEEEIELFRLLRSRSAGLLLGGVSPGLSGFPQALGADPEGFLAPVHWHPALDGLPDLGPSTTQVLDDARFLGLAPIDYVAAQAYAAALIAAYCSQRNPTDPAKVARSLRTSTFFGNFRLDSQTGEQAGHQMAVIQWRSGRQELIAER